MKKAVLYRRVSTKDQQENGNSLDDQRSALMRYCKKHGLEVIGDFEDARSGRSESTHKRAGLAAAIELCKEKKAVLVFWAWDRLARSFFTGLRLLDDIITGGGGIIAIEDNFKATTPMELAIIGLMLAKAEEESMRIGKRVKLANAETVKRLGYRTNGEQPFGWRIQDGKRVRVPEEQAALKRMKELHKRNWSYGLIVETLNAEGHKPRHAKTWTRGSVHRLLNQRKR